MFIIASKPGQLGNMLLTFAHFIGSAREHGFHVANPAFDNYAEHFQTTAQDLFCRYPPQASKLPTDKRLRRLLYNFCHATARLLGKFNFDSGWLRVVTIRDWTTDFNLGDPQFLSSVKPRQHILFRGWGFRHHAAVAKHAGAIREFFHPLEKYQSNIERLIARARDGADVLVGVHIRYGYIDFPDLRQYYYEPQQYAEIMGRVESLFPGQRVVFLICSDKQQNPEIFSRFKIIFGNDHVIEDMYSFARCDYVVGPPSTYTMWASFYGQVPLYMIADPQRTPTLADFNVHVEQAVGRQLYATTEATRERQVAAT